MGKIVLRGYYGFGNFGDDILMLAAFNICKDVFPSSEFIISTDSKNPSYISKLIPGVRIVDSSFDVEADWIIHGGGGVFFDFRSGGWLNVIVNFFIKAIGYTRYAKAIRLYKSIRGKGYNKANARAGLGIAIGTYTSSSHRLKSDILALSDFDLLLVRDNPSVFNAKKYCASAQIYKTTDLAFIDDYWRNEKRIRQDNTKSIGFVLRDWSTNNHVAVFIDVAKRLRLMGIDVQFFSFDESADPMYISSASELSEVYCWKPNELQIEDFLNRLEMCRLIISSRAHGAIISACLGIPTLCIGIEPKLSQVADMLNKSSGLIVEPFSQEDIIKIITEKLHQIPLLKEAALLDVARNREEISHALTLFKNFVQQPSNLKNR